MLQWPVALLLRIGARCCGDEGRSRGCACGKETGVDGAVLSAAGGLWVTGYMRARPAVVPGVMQVARVRDNTAQH